MILQTNILAVSTDAVITISAVASAIFAGLFVYTLLKLRAEKRTSQKLLQKQRKLTRDLLGKVMRKLPLHAVLSDSHGKILAVSRKFAIQAGLDPDQIAGQNLSDFTTPDKRQLLADHLNALFTGESKSFTIAQTIALKNANTISVSATTRRIGNAKTDDLALTIIQPAIEPRIQSQAQLRQVQKLEALGQLAGGIAHDFNNLLSSIMGNAELLLLQLDGESEAQNFADTILKTAMRASHLTRQLLTFSYKSNPNIAQLNSHEIIAESIELLMHSIDRKIAIATDLSAEVPATKVDATQLQNAILNLCVNARDAMPSGGTLTIGTKNVQITRENCAQQFTRLTPGQYLEISISDQGSGIDPEIQEKIFEPFFTTKPNEKGTGLGLSMVFGFVINHHGSICVDSRRDCGTTFRILLPCCLEAVGKSTELPSEIVKGQGHILLIDDEESVRDFTAKMLHKLGYTVSTCHDGQQAVEFFKTNHKEIDLVLLDMVMPRLDGFDTFHELRAIAPDIKILICSGFSQNETVSSLVDSGALGFIGKPFRIDTLSQNIAQNISTQSVVEA